MSDRFKNGKMVLLDEADVCKGATDEGCNFGYCDVQRSGGWTTGDLRCTLSKSAIDRSMRVQIAWHARM